VHVWIHGETEKITVGRYFGKNYI